jgi:hypothetical protein
LDKENPDGIDYWKAFSTPALTAVPNDSILEISAIQVPNRKDDTSVAGAIVDGTETSIAPTTENVME